MELGLAHALRCTNRGQVEAWLAGWGMTAQVAEGDVRSAPTAIWGWWDGPAGTPRGLQSLHLSPASRLLPTASCTLACTLRRRQSSLPFPQAARAVGGGAAAPAQP